MMREATHDERKQSLIVDDALREIGRLQAQKAELVESCRRALIELQLARASRNPDVNQAAVILSVAIASAEGVS